MARKKGLFSGDFLRSVLVSGFGGVLSFFIISAILSGLMFAFFRETANNFYHWLQTIIK